DAHISRFADLVVARDGDICAKCGRPLALTRGIEVGQVFKLGTKYSAAFNAVYKNDRLEEKVMIMGCYGVGVSRTLQAVIEQSHDKDGIIWPASVAPFQAVIDLLDPADEAAREHALLSAFIGDLRRRVPPCRPLGEGAPRLPGLAAVLLPGLSSERAVAELDLLGIQVSGGAACASRERAASHVYRAMGLSEEDAACVLRVSIGRSTTQNDLREAAEAIARVYSGSRAQGSTNPSTPPGNRA
ncbi:MAG: aminotransferase class V-fold PLP-dependent enzyme, partial [Clostridia bacterium]|nr:aminotransferase class V-fold PLP-dependent enzyme [Clostridia bacterium]